MSQILITEFMHHDGIEFLRKRFEVTYDPELHNDPECMHRQVALCRAMILRNRTSVTNVLLDGAPELICLGRLGVGLDNIDLDACKRKKIKIISASGVNHNSVGEYVVMAAMTLLRDAILETDRVLQGHWPRKFVVGQEIAGKTLGLVGLGRTARSAAAKARCLDMKVIAHDPYLAENHDVWTGVQRLELDELLSQSDVVSVHVPLMVGTRNLISERRVGQMKQGAFLINTSRGGIVDESALARALRENRLGGAALDVFETEPLTRNAAKRFAGLKNLLLTPHIAGITRESNRRVGMYIARHVANHLDLVT